MDTEFRTDPDFALELDRQDPLAAYRSRFALPDPGLIYLDGNSLGRLPLAAAMRARQVVEQEWGSNLVRGWNKGWWEAPGRVGEKIARVVGAGSGQVVVSDTTSVNLFKLVLAALALRPGKNRIVTDTLNFPSDLYVLEGCIRLLGDRHDLVRIDSPDGEISPDLAALQAAINDDTALLTLSHVVFKSGYRYDLAALAETAHRHGALVLWDLSHSAGAVPVELDAWGADLAVGCTYKYLNGGPGSPAFLYVRGGLQAEALSPIWGWWGQQAPFAFGQDFAPAPGVQRFLTGTQPVLSLLTMEAALDVLLEAGLPALYAKSQRLTGYLIRLADEWLAPLGFRLGTPRDPDRRGSHVSLRHPEGYRLNRALIEEMNVLPDFREPDNLRLGLAPLYTTFAEVREAVERIRRAAAEGRHLKYPSARQTVT